MDTRPRKRFGQNFLTDNSVIRRIVAAVNPQPGEHLLEIGPGQGALTAPLVQSGADLTLVEIDRDLAAMLAVRYPGVPLITADVLKVELSEVLLPGTRVVGNLPYNISTPLLFRLFEVSENIVDMHFMLQLEVVDRLTASPSTGSYGRLSVMAQYYCETQKMFEVPPEAFSPQPKVHSAVIGLRPRRERLALDPVWLDRVLIKAFSARRKTVRNALKGLISSDELEHLGIDPALRPENLTIENFADCANLLSHRGAPEAGA
ncbi:MAG: 16S rRNA (adenine(1518)-N(6)/adenine(1519)-N(6))-dimethyltransferase RsmA [Proteobacteria bacterium]|nr:16S rRNA (adenine(1518)-N(6)/adenine(1519)-N(6))-dimethyltransferase RsmA [Pseudomonadota bacterium]